MPQISASVGSRGRNREADVAIVQRLLNRWQTDIGRSTPLQVDGRAGRQTVAAIVEFQGRVVGMVEPDGRVDPGGRTLRVLNKRALTLTLLPKSGNGYYSYGVKAKRHGTRATLASIRRAARALAALDLEVGVGNISFKHGGRMRPHVSHQRGVDVDFRPLRSDGRRRPVRFQAAAYSRADTARLVRILRRDPNLQLIFFNDKSIPGVLSQSGHDNHLHVRFEE